MNDTDERCVYCRVSTYYINRSESGLCDQCINDPDALEAIKLETILKDLKNVEDELQDPDQS